MLPNEHFRELWSKRGDGYSHQNSSAAVVPPPLDGYRRVYYLSKSDHALSNMVYRRLKVARFRDLNDPFELSGVRQFDKRQRSLMIVRVVAEDDLAFDFAFAFPRLAARAVAFDVGDVQRVADRHGYVLLSITQITDRIAARLAAGLKAPKGFPR